MTKQYRNLQLDDLINFYLRFILHYVQIKNKDLKKSVNVYNRRLNLYGKFVVYFVGFLI